MVHLSLFCSHFSPKKLICNEKIIALDHAVDRSVATLVRGWPGAEAGAA